MIGSELTGMSKEHKFGIAAVVIKSRAWKII